jgi:hypothetical protein
MSAVSNPGNGGRRRYGVALGALVTLATAGASLYLFRGCSAVDSGDSQVGAASRLPAVAPSVAIEVPRFGRPEEAQRYFSAMTEGDRRSLALLDEALSKARREPGAAPAHVAELERDRSFRSQRLAVYEKELQAVLRAAPAAP